MDEKEKVKWFLGGASIATGIMLAYRKYEMTIIGMGIDKIINTPELLAQVQSMTKTFIK